MRDILDILILNVSPSTFLFSECILDAHWEQIQEFGVLNSGAIVPSVTPVVSGLPGGAAKPLGNGTEQRAACCLCLSHAVCVLPCVPTACSRVSQGWAVTVHQAFSFQRCRPADYCNLLVFNTDYATLPRPALPGGAVPARARSLLLSVPPCAGRFRLEQHESLLASACSHDNFSLQFVFWIQPFSYAFVWERGSAALMWWKSCCCKLFPGASIERGCVGVASGRR